MILDPSAPSWREKQERKKTMKKDTWGGLSLTKGIKDASEIDSGTAFMDVKSKI